jgi:hypothetical protein
MIIQKKSTYNTKKKVPLAVRMGTDSSQLQDTSYISGSNNQI